jgi:putative Holliday junction resolvase
MGRILAVDYGTKRVGLAVTDPLKIIANTLTTVHSKDVITFLTEYFKKEEVECIVVGKPMQMDGSDSQSAREVEKFIHLLRKNFPDMPVERVDERFTSAMAKRTMLEMGLGKKARANKGSVDQISAAIILQSWLEMR